MNSTETIAQKKVETQIAFYAQKAAEIVENPAAIEFIKNYPLLSMVILGLKTLTYMNAIQIADELNSSKNKIWLEFLPGILSLLYVFKNDSNEQIRSFAQYSIDLVNAILEYSKMLNSK